MNKKNILIIILALLLIWFGFNIVRLENYHYAVQVGICDEYDNDILERFEEKEECINSAKTRTNFIWHLVYGLGILN
jgi:uncharacterized membrane protein